MSTERPESTESPEREAGQDNTQAPDPVRAAVDRVLTEKAEDDAAATPRRGPGRPRGSKTRKRSRDRKRTSERRREPADVDAEAEKAPAPAPEPPTEAELVGLGVFLGTVWRIAGARLRRRPLTDREQGELARAAHPVLAKYGGGVLDEWGAEIALGITLIGMWQATEMPPEPDQLDAPETLGESVAGM